MKLWEQKEPEFCNSAAAQKAKDRANKQIEIAKIELADKRRDRVEYWMINPPVPFLVHLKENVAKGDYSKGIKFSKYS